MGGVVGAPMSGLSGTHRLGGHPVVDIEHPWVGARAPIGGGCAHGCEVMGRGSRAPIAGEHPWVLMGALPPSAEQRVPPEEGAEGSLREALRRVLGGLLGSPHGPALRRCPQVPPSTHGCGGHPWVWGGYPWGRGTPMSRGGTRRGHQWVGAVLVEERAAMGGWEHP